MNIQSIYLELFSFFITVLYFFHFMNSERNLTILIKVNRLSLLIESCSECPKLLGFRFSSSVVNIPKVIHIFHNGTNLRILFFFRFMTSERNLTTLVKVNRLSLLIESCSACPKLLGFRFS